MHSARFQARRTTAPRHSAVETLEKRRLLSVSAFVTQTNLTSDLPGVAAHQNTELVNAWGISYGPTSPFWISANGSGTSTLETADGTPQSLEVTLPPTAHPTVIEDPTHTQSAPTGQVFNTDQTGFKVTDGTNTKPATFMFVSEDGGIYGWNGGVGGAPPSHTAELVKDNSASGAVYKGMAIATMPDGSTNIYVADFHNNQILVYNDTWGTPTLTGSFQDHQIRKGFAPFNIQNVGGNLVVTYAKQDAAAHDDVAGHGLGFVDVYDTNGNLLEHFHHSNALNSPWGVAMAPKDAAWGPLGGDYLIGQFGSGQIAIYRPDGKFDGLLEGADGKPVMIDGLWALTFGGGNVKNGSTDTLFFTAGPQGESHGLFGSLTVGLRQDHGNGHGPDKNDNNNDGDNGDGEDFKDLLPDSLK
jgi:uncharacterized protein (TIGR03118 family)